MGGLDPPIQGQQTPSPVVLDGRLKAGHDMIANLARRILWREQERRATCARRTRAMARRTHDAKAKRRYFDWVTMADTGTRTKPRDSNPRAHWAMRVMETG